MNDNNVKVQHKSTKLNSKEKLKYSLKEMSVLFCSHRCGIGLSLMLLSVGVLVLSLVFEVLSNWPLILAFLLTAIGMIIVVNGIIKDTDK